MIKMFRGLLMSLVGVMVATTAFAGPAEDAQSLVEKAIAHYDAVGKEKAFADFNDKANVAWVDEANEKYVIVAEADPAKKGNFLVHAINPKLIGNPKLWDLQDLNKVFIIRDMVKVGQESPNGGWSKYVWTNPKTKKLAPKNTYVKVHDNMLFMVGYYE